MEVTPRFKINAFNIIDIWCIDLLTGIYCGFIAIIRVLMMSRLYVFTLDILLSDETYATDKSLVAMY